MLPLLVAGGAALAGAITSSATAKSNTNKTIAAQQSLSDSQNSYNLKMWNLQNAYNSPTKQMERLKTAGLNPNLVYGNGATGNTTSQAPKAEGYNPQYNYKNIDPAFMSGILNNYQDYKIKGAQVDNVQAATDNLTAKTATEALKQAQVSTATAKNKFQLRLAKQLENTSLQVAEANLRNKQIDLNKKALDMSKIKQETLRLKLDNNLRKLGVQPNDNMLYRILSRYLTGGYDGYMKKNTEFKKYFNKLR